MKVGTKSLFWYHQCGCWAMAEVLNPKPDEQGRYFVLFVGQGTYGAMFAIPKAS